MENETDNQRPKIGIGVMIWKNNKVLIGRRKNRHGDGEYSFTGGHLEYSQSFENCAKQETLEEAGIHIRNIKFLCVANGTQYAPRHDVLVGLSAEWESGEPRTNPEERIGDWKWYDLDELPQPLFAFAGIMVKAYKSGQNYFDIEK